MNQYTNKTGYIQMNQPQFSTLGESCIKAYKRLLHECVAFMAARLYLMEVHHAALNQVEPIKKAHDAFLYKLNPHYETPYQYFIERSFISLVAAFELFLQDVVTAIVVANPKKVGQVEFKLAEILDASGMEELVRRGTETTLNKLMYKKPMEYLNELTLLLSVDPEPLRPQWRVFVEAKARRDLGVHNGWRCNSIYLRKVSETGLVSTIELGDSASLEEAYLVSVGDAISKLGFLLMNSINDKYIT